MEPCRASLKEILAEAVTRHDPAARAAYLNEACAGDASLRAEVEALARAYDEEGESVEAILAAPERDGLREGPGTVIGRYKLLQEIGEGGFGLVFMAEQLEPVQRKVALKIIKAGMDTREVIARFEAERQALALMDHSNIARVLDAGATESGRPYFVMELVKGLKITDYSDQNHLSTEERLALFLKVCHAVQHAHQKGIIHRDLKPSNVMVTLHDGEAVPKVIDFGIAKATGQRLTDKTLFTRYEQMIGTPAYMSPEQAQMGGLDIDTRTDIYALGVLLYELLTGVTPFDKQTLAKAAFDEIRRMIRETDPPKPSTRLQGLGERGTQLAKHRQTEPGALRRLLLGDLDRIAMKALEKDRRRRYETANDLAEDIQRHLHHLPVLASPPGTAYRLRKFVRRHRVGVAMATAVTVALVAGMSFALAGFHRARQERDRAVQAEAAASRERDRALQAENKMRLERDRAIKAEADTSGILSVFSGNLGADENLMALQYSAAQLARKRLDPANPASMNLTLPLGRNLGRLGAWTNALEVYLWLTQAVSWSCDYWTHAHAAALAAALPETSRQLREKIAKRFGDTKDPITAMQVGRAILIDPDFQEHLAIGLDCADRAYQALPRQSWCQIVKGIAEYRRDRWPEALKMLQDAESNPDTRLGVLACCFGAMARHRAGQTTAARETLDHASQELRRLWQTGVLASNEWHFVVFDQVACAEAERVILGGEGAPRMTAESLEEVRVNSRFVHENLAQGDLLARKKRWLESRDAYVRALEQPSFDWGRAEGQSTQGCLSLHLGTVFVRAGDRTNFVRLCDRLLAMRPDKPTTLATQHNAALKANRYAKTCFLDPASLSPAVRQGAQEMAQYAFAQKQDGNSGWRCQTSGIAEYYAGTPERAIELLQQAEQDQHLLVKGIAVIFRAMALKKLNRLPEAARALQEGEGLLKRAREAQTGYYWWDFEQGELALQEARKLIGSNSP